MAPLDVTPTKIAEMLYRIIQDPMRKVQVEELGKEYAAGKCDKDKLMECLQYVATGKEMTQALRVLVPGYDEMCGGSPPAAAAVLGPAMPTDVSDPDEKAAAEAKAVAEAKAAEKAAMPNLKKGFLSGKSLAPKQAASSAAPTVAAGSKAAAAAPTLDTTTPNPHLFREQYHQHMHEAMPEMDPKTQEHIMHNNFVMHDQERAGNGGNVTIDSNGRATVRTDDDLGGAADGYTWGQNESEVYPARNLALNPPWLLTHCAFASRVWVGDDQGQGRQGYTWQRREAESDERERKGGSARARGTRRPVARARRRRRLDVYH